MHSQSFGQRQRQRLTQSQVMILRIKKTKITPNGDCPKCNRNLTEEEIKAGWLNDVADFTTKCPDCGTRFQATLILTEKGRVINSITYLCGSQLFHRLKKVQRGKSKKLGKHFLYKNHPTLLWNLVRHFGTYEEGLKVFKKEKQ